MYVFTLNVITQKNGRKNRSFWHYCLTTKQYRFSTAVKCWLNKSYQSYERSFNLFGTALMFMCPTVRDPFCCWKQSYALVFNQLSSPSRCNLTTRLKVLWVFFAGFDNPLTSLLSSLSPVGPHRRRSDEKRSLPGDIRSLHRRLKASSPGLRKCRRMQRPSSARLCPASPHNILHRPCLCCLHQRAS